MVSWGNRHSYYPKQVKQRSYKIVVHTGDPVILSKNVPTKIPFGAFAVVRLTL